MAGLHLHLQKIVTCAADTNPAMLAVDARLGFRPTRADIDYQADHG